MNESAKIIFEKPDYASFFDGILEFALNIQKGKPQF